MFAEWSVDEKLGVAIDDHVETIRPTFMHLQDLVGLIPSRPEIGSGSRGRDDAKAHFVKATRDRSDRRLVGVGNRDQHRPVEWQSIRRRELRLRECGPERVRDAHHFTRRPHFWAEYRVRPRKL